MWDADILEVGALFTQELDSAVEKNSLIFNIGTANVIKWRIWRWDGAGLLWGGHPEIQRGPSTSEAWELGWHRRQKQRPKKF